MKMRILALSLVIFGSLMSLPNIYGQTSADTLAPSPYESTKLYQDYLTHKQKENALKKFVKNLFSKQQEKIPRIQEVSQLLQLIKRDVNSAKPQLKKLAQDLSAQGYREDEKSLAHFFTYGNQQGLFIHPEKSRPMTMMEIFAHFNSLKQLIPAWKPPVSTDPIAPADIQNLLKMIEQEPIKALPLLNELSQALKTKGLNEDATSLATFFSLGNLYGSFTHPKEKRSLNLAEVISQFAVMKQTVLDRAYTEAFHFQQKPETCPADLNQPHALKFLVEALYRPTQIAVQLLQAPEKTTAPAKECQVCFCDFNDESPQVVHQNCGHGVSCSDCFAQNIKIKIKDGDVVPYLTCTQPGCKAPLHFSDLMKGKFSPAELALLAKHHLEKTVVTLSDKQICSHCNFINLQASTLNKCKSCQTELKKAPVEDSLEVALREGTLKKCPKCQQGHLSRDKGMCNAIQCPSCRIWVNWETFQTFSSCEALKSDARARGKLWMPGELEYQQKLERENPEAFKQLLKNNGIDYKPGYVRGS